MTTMPAPQYELNSKLSQHEEKDIFFPEESHVTFERCPDFWIASVPPFPGVTVHEN